MTNRERHADDRPTSARTSPTTCRSCERIVAHFMRRLPRSVQREDLIAAGTLGLFHALRSSAHTCPEMFASYARIRIRGSIVDELRRHDWSPRRRKDPSANVREGHDGDGPSFGPASTAGTIPGAAQASIPMPPSRDRGSPSSASTIFRLVRRRGLLLRGPERLAPRRRARASRPRSPPRCGGAARPSASAKSSACATSRACRARPLRRPWV